MTGQIETRNVKISFIMGKKAFKKGVMDGFLDLPHNVDAYPPDQQWSYERGRLFGILFPEHLEFKLGNKIKREAQRAYAQASREGLIL